MSSTPDYYRILGVAPYSDPVVIQAAYRALMRQYHPDTSTAPDAKTRAPQINEAYAVLGNPARRARYDTELRANDGRNHTSSRPDFSQPPPQSRARPAGNYSPSGQATSRFVESQWKNDKRVGGLVLGSFIVILILVAALTESGDQSPLPTEFAPEQNLLMEDLTNDAGNAADAALDAAVAEGSEETSAAIDTTPVKLSEIAQPPVQFADVESAASNFARVLLQNGISGARAESERCHKQVIQAPSWSRADICAAFDFAAAFVDKEVSRASGWQPMEYFRFQAENQSDRYEEAGAYAYTSLSRVSKIKITAERAAGEALRIELAKGQKTEPVEAATSDPDNIMMPPAAAEE